MNWPPSIITISKILSEILKVSLKKHSTQKTHIPYYISSSLTHIHTQTSGQMWQMQWKMSLSVRRCPQGRITRTGEHIHYVPSFQTSNSFGDALWTPRRDTDSFIELQSLNDRLPRLSCTPRRAMADTVSQSATISFTGRLRGRNRAIINRLDRRSEAINGVRGDSGRAVVLYMLFI